MVAVHITQLEIESISDTVAQDEDKIYNSDTLESLKKYLTVTGQYNDGTPYSETIGYELSLKKGSAFVVVENVLVVTYKGKSSEFVLNVTLAKQNYDMSGIGFTDKTVKADGNAHALAISGTLPSNADTESTFESKNDNFEFKGFGYVINMNGDGGKTDATGCEITVEDSELTDWNAFNIWVSGATIKLNNTTLKGICNPAKGNNSFSIIVLNDGGGSSSGVAMDEM